MVKVVSEPLDNVDVRVTGAADVEGLPAAASAVGVGEPELAAGVDTYRMSVSARVIVGGPENTHRRRCGWGCRGRGRARSGRT